MRQLFAVTALVAAGGSLGLLSEGDVAFADGCTVSAGVTQTATTVTGTVGADNIDCSGAGHGHTIDGLGGDDNIIGSNFPDTIKGNMGADTIQGYAGTDSLDGGPGDDLL